MQQLVEVPQAFSEYVYIALSQYLVVSPTLSKCSHNIFMMPFHHMTYVIM